MARNCMFYSESNDMGATIPFCNFENSSDWICCKYYDPRRGSTQELCPHYISRKDGLETLRRTESSLMRRSKMTNREKWMPKIIDDHIIEESICHKFVDSMTEWGDCPKCPIGALCRRFVDGGLTDSEYMKAVSEWFDKEAE